MSYPIMSFIEVDKMVLLFSATLILANNESVYLSNQSSSSQKNTPKVNWIPKGVKK